MVTIELKWPRMIGSVANTATKSRYWATLNPRAATRKSVPRLAKYLTRAQTGFHMAPPAILICHIYNDFLWCAYYEVSGIPYEKYTQGPPRDPSGGHISSCSKVYQHGYQMKAFGQRNLEMSIILPFGKHWPDPVGKSTPCGQIFIIPKVYQYGYQMTSLGQRNVNISIILPGTHRPSPGVYTYCMGSPC